ncbi:hypothetical protein T4B_1585 [Trichinella pseudospiralis]|uniref:Uncharacterized protein n=1 Tax=Trichinella pseudospiralis TaxID=6337 RepID=A0A0V1GHT4_TRIPS|nr:hypothetical protein T4B_1585 [Trichinella pseudospiralis]KRY97726.1 hypothetical protein T4C_11111 [Trichinella pseudospiralis]
MDSVKASLSVCFQVNNLQMEACLNNEKMIFDAC